MMKGFRHAAGLLMENKLRADSNKCFWHVFTLLRFRKKTDLVYLRFCVCCQSELCFGTSNKYKEKEIETTFLGFLVMNTNVGGWNSLVRDQVNFFFSMAIIKGLTYARMCIIFYNHIK